jgi:hypothetical protein
MKASPAAWCGRAVRALAVVWLIAHFSLTLAYVLPMNPAKTTIEARLQKTFGRFFSQNWSLFAPNPVSSNLSMSAVCMTSDEAASALNGEFPETGWADLSLPLWYRFQDNRFAAYDRLARPITSWLRNYAAGSAGTLQQGEACRKGHKPSCESYEATLAIERQVAATRLGRVGAAYCKDIDLKGRFSAVGIALHEQKAKPWSQRDSETPESYSEVIGVYLIDDKLASAGIYTAQEYQP